MFASKLVRFRQATILVLVTLISALWTMTLNHSEFSLYEIKVFSIYVAVVLSAELLILAVLMLLRKLSKFFDLLASAVATVFTTYNVFTLVIAHNAQFSGLGGMVFWLFVAGVGLVLSLLFFLRKKEVVKFFHVLCAIMTVVIGVQFMGDSVERLKGLLDRIPDHIRYVDFKKKPNIYLISFDALVPETVVRNLIGVEDVKYPELVREYGGRIIPNTFAERIPTKKSLNLTLAMDVEHYYNVSEDAGFIRDEVPNPAYEILRHNGYKIQFIYKTAYFGDDHGKLDFYGIAQSDGLCMHVAQDYSFMGYCLPRVQEKIRRFTKINRRDQAEYLFERIKTVSQSDDPWFTYSYIYKPGHASMTMDYRDEAQREDYAETFNASQDDLLLEMEALFKTIKENDPDAVTIIFGDHGAFVSMGQLNDYRGLSEDAIAAGPENRLEDTPLTFEQIVQDRHGVFHAVFPEDFCPEGFTHNPYSTVRILRDLFKCLSDGDDPLPTDYQADDSRWAPYLIE